MSDMRAAFLGSVVALLASQAVAQQTNCYTTGYGQQQHLWCNTTPAPQAGSYQAPPPSQAAYAATLGQAAADARVAQIQAQAKVQADQMIKAFRASPGHERFGELEPYMAEIIRSNRATNLQDAYTLAAAEHPAH